MGHNNVKLSSQGQDISCLHNLACPDLDSISYNLPFLIYGLTHQLWPTATELTTFALTLHSHDQNNQDAPRRDNKLTCETAIRSPNSWFISLFDWVWSLAWWSRLSWTTIFPTAVFWPLVLVVSSFWAPPGCSNWKCNHTGSLHKQRHPGKVCKGMNNQVCYQSGEHECN